MKQRYFQSLNHLPDHFERIEAPSIWLRDFMPLQRQDGGMVGFTYGCHYMHDFGEEMFDPAEIWARYDLKVNRLPLIADGGHFIETSRHWFASEAIFAENPNYLKSEIHSMLTEALDKPVRWLPPMPDDFTGHLDGVVRWFQGNVVLVYDWFPCHRLRFWQANMNCILRNSGYKLVTVKTTLSDDPISAEGLSLNYVFDGTTFYGATPEAPVPQMPYRYINAPEVLAEGGGMHCITYNYKEQPNQL
jgi:hypothetical protein